MASQFKHVCLTVSNLAAASMFFEYGLQLDRLHDGTEEFQPPDIGQGGGKCRRVRFSFPGSGSELHLMQGDPGRSIDTDHANPGTCHIAFYTDNIDIAFADLARFGAQLCSDEIVTVVGGVFDGGRALYCAGPDGIRIELLQGEVYLDGTPRRNAAPRSIGNANEATHFGVHVKDRDLSLRVWRDLCEMASVAEWVEETPATRAVIGYHGASLNMAILRLLQTQSFCEVIEYRGTNGRPVDNSIRNPGACHFCISVSDIAEAVEKIVALGLDYVRSHDGVAFKDPDGFTIQLTAEPLFA